MFDAQIGITLIKNYITKIIDFMINQLTLISLKKYIFLNWMGIYVFQNTTVEGGGGCWGKKLKLINAGEKMKKKSKRGKGERTG